MGRISVEWYATGALPRTPEFIWQDDGSSFAVARYSSFSRRSVTARAARIVTPRVSARLISDKKSKVRPIQSPITAKTTTTPRPKAEEPFCTGMGFLGAVGVMSMMSGCASSMFCSSDLRRRAYSSGEISPRSSRASSLRIAFKTAVTFYSPVHHGRGRMGIGAEFGKHVISCDVVNRFGQAMPFGPLGAVTRMLLKNQEKGA